MTRIIHDATGEKVYETGVSMGVLFLADASGNYNQGYGWNGLTAVNSKPTGAEPSAQYADNQKYLNLISNEEFAATIEAFTYPREFDACNGLVSPKPGISIGQQGRRGFAFAYRTEIGNDTEGLNYGYKIHLIYGAIAKPSEKNYATNGESPEAVKMSWEVSTTPVPVPNLKPTAEIVISSLDVSAATMKAIEDAIYGTEGSDPHLPSPAELIDMVDGAGAIEATPVAPTKNGNVLTVPSTTGVVYMIDGKPVSGNVTITKQTLVTAKPAKGYHFPENTQDEWGFSPA